MNINRFFTDTLGAQLKNPRWSWGATDPLNHRVYLRVWQDGIHKSATGERIHIARDKPRRESNGFAERHAHIDLIRAGAEGFGVVCTAVDPDTSGTREIASFDEDFLIRFGSITEENGNTYAEIRERVPVDEFARPQTMNAISAPAIGTRFTRDQIHLRYGGSKQSYLPTRDGAIVCGCFDPSLNKRAPREIDVGKGPVVETTAQTLVGSQLTIPVFLKEAANRWRYVGMFRAVEFSRDAEDLSAYPDRRPDAVGVLYLEEFDSSDSQPLPPDADDYFAMEGREVLRRHLARERSPYLAELKKRESSRSTGFLTCEACSLNSATLPKDIGEAAFEVHHRLPLAGTGQNTKTRINDLAILCANCHRMIHRTQPFQTVEQFARMRKDC